MTLLAACAVPYLPWRAVVTYASAQIVANPLTLLSVALAGFLAQMVDGALGMGYGLTSSSVLVYAGLAPRTASEVIHLAQLGTTLVSGVAHHRAGTVHWATARLVALPGMAGAMIGVTLLSSLPVATAKVMSSMLLLTVGLYLFVRFHSPRVTQVADAPLTKPPCRALLVAMGLTGGVVDVAGGGGWGPVVTTGLLAEGRLSPALVIGTVSLSEFFVTVAAVAAFGLSSLFGSTAVTAATAASLRLDLMVALLVGGVIAAPVAPLMVTKLPAPVLGVLVGGFIVLTNLRVIFASASIPPPLAHAMLCLWAGAWMSASLRVGMRTEAEGGAGGAGGATGTGISHTKSTSTSAAGSRAPPPSAPSRARTRSQQRFLWESMRESLWESTDRIANRLADAVIKAVLSGS